MLDAEILLVEDERIVAHHLQRQLSKLGYQVTGIAANGRQALEYVQNRRPALVLMDINIEGEMDGIETASLLPEGYHIPVIYLTSYSEEATLERARATKPYGYLLKPFAERELHATIQMALERRQAELALRASEEQLRQSQKMEVVGQLAGGVAHDFNNLLAIISGNLELIQEMTDGNAELQDILRDALDATVRGASLTQQLLAYSRQQPLAPKTIDLRRLISNLTELLTRTLGETIKIRHRIDGELWRIKADPQQLENAILNLALNARDAMAEGGDLTIECQNVVLDEDYAKEQLELEAGPYVLIAVTDNGCGMTPDVVEKALEPFFTTKPIGQGTGLGLSMVFGFIKQSQGHIRIYSEPGSGTTVRLYLPRAESDSTRVTTSTKNDEIPTASEGETVLVVEDDPMVRKLIVQLLTGLGYQIIEAENGPAALERLAAAGRIDMLLTDLVLPEAMNGSQLATAMREVRPDLRVLFMSGYAAGAVVNNGMLDDGTPLLSKPFRKAELARQVRAILDQGES